MTGIARAGLILFPEFSEFEVTAAASFLRALHQLVTVALTDVPVTSEAGLTFLPRKSLADVRPQDFEVLIIPGGNMVHLKDAEPLFSFVREMSERGALLAAICSGPYVLARAGVLAGRPYTVTYTREQRAFLGCFEKTGYRYEPVVQDENVITAQGHAFVAFGLAVARHLRGPLENNTHAFYEGRHNTFMEAPPDSA